MYYLDFINPFGALNCVGSDWVHCNTNRFCNHSRFVKHSYILFGIVTPACLHVKVKDNVYKRLCLDAYVVLCVNEETIVI